MRAALLLLAFIAASACTPFDPDRVPLERDATVRVLNEELLEPAAAAVSVYNQGLPDHAQLRLSYEPHLLAQLPPTAEVTSDEWIMVIVHAGSTIASRLNLCRSNGRKTSRAAIRYGEQRIYVCGHLSEASMAISVAHELGHLAGLAHNETPAMASPSENALPSELDVLRLRELYAAE